MKKKPNGKNYDSFDEVVEFQNNALNPGHYIGTGRVPPSVSAPGNATPLVILYFVAAAIFLAFGLLLFFSDVNITSSGLIESPLANKIITLIIFVVIALFCLLLAFAYLGKAKRYHKEKKVLAKDRKHQTEEEEDWQLTCPQCGKSHRVEFSKCPHCQFDYLA